MKEGIHSTEDAVIVPLSKELEIVELKAYVDTKNLQRLMDAGIVVIRREGKGYNMRIPLRIWDYISRARRPGAPLMLRYLPLCNCCGECMERSVVKPHGLKGCHYTERCNDCIAGCGFLGRCSTEHMWRLGMSGLLGPIHARLAMTKWTYHWPG